MNTEPSSANVNISPLARSRAQISLMDPSSSNPSKLRSLPSSLPQSPHMHTAAIEMHPLNKPTSVENTVGKSLQIQVPLDLPTTTTATTAVASSPSFNGNNSTTNTSTQRRSGAQSPVTSELFVPVVNFNW